MTSGDFDKELDRMLGDTNLGFKGLQESTKEQTARQKELTKAGKDYDNALGTALRTVTTPFKVLASAAVSVTKALGTTITVLGAVGTGLAAIANPTAWETLKSSLALVAVQLGSYFLPVIIGAAYGAQLLAHWLEQLNPEVQKSITRFASLAAMAFLAVQAFALLTSSTVLLTGAVIAAVVALKLLPHVIDWVGNRLREIINKMGGGAGTGMWDTFKATLPMALGAAADSFKNSKIGGFFSAMGAAAPWKVFGSGGAAGATGPTFAEMIRKAIKDELGIDLDALLQEADKLRKRIGGGAVEGGAPKGGPKRGFLPDFLTGQMKEMQPRFTAVEEARKQYQLAALKDPLEQKMWEEMRKAAVKFNAMAGDAKAFFEWGVRNGLGFM